VLVAADGAEAVTVFRAAPGRVALAVLDAGMPRLSGHQVFELLRGLDPTVRVLFASGYHGGGLVPEMAPGTRTLNKPYTPSELAAAVHDLLAAPSVG
jgi:CheY-like chemotaxis protein